MNSEAMRLPVISLNRRISASEQKRMQNEKVMILTEEMMRKEAISDSFSMAVSSQYSFSADAMSEMLFINSLNIS